MTDAAAQPATTQSAATQPVVTQAVLAPPAKAAIFLVVTVRAGSEAAVLDFLSDVAGLTRAVAFREPEGALSCVTGIGSQLWDRLFAGSAGPAGFSGPKPAGLHPFTPLTGPVHAAVATPGDLLFHLRAARHDLCFELARQIMAALSNHVDLADETHGFRYFDERDLMGFVDGTENPAGTAAARAVTIGTEDPAFAGGSYVIVQKYVHDLEAWQRLTVEEQEQAFGRHKLSDIEFADEDKAPNSHLVLNTITDPDGTERKIVRDNLAFGRVGEGEFGTYFIGYAANPDVIEEMLRHMFLGDPPGTYDRILDFSTALTGGLFFVPTADFLDDPGAALAAAAGYDAAGRHSGYDAGAAAGDTTPTDGAAPPVIPDGSLRIGSLKGDPS